MDGWEEGRKEDGRIDEWMEGRKDGRIGGWMEGRIGGWMDAWMEGREGEREGGRENDFSAAGCLHCAVYFVSLQW